MDGVARRLDRLCGAKMARSRRSRQDQQPARAGRGAQRVSPVGNGQTAWVRAARPST
jgi:hypothetical protein